MKEFYVKHGLCSVSVMMRRTWHFDICIKSFPYCDDEEFAKLQAEELVEHLNL